MALDWKKILTIIIFVAAIAIFSFVLYYFFFKPIFSPAPTTEPVATTTPAQLPTTVNINGKIYVLNSEGRLPGAGSIDENTLIPLEEAVKATETAVGTLTQANELLNETPSFSTLSSDGNLIYFSQANKKFYQLTPDGQTKDYNDKIFYQVSNVTWSPDAQKAILEYPDGAKIIYDFQTGEQISLPKHWQDFSFSPDSEQFIFKNLALDPENRFLAIASADGSQTKIVEAIGGIENQIQAAWSPNNQVVATLAKTTGFGRSDVYFIGQNQENFKLMTVEGWGFEGKWSPNGKKMIYSVYNAANNYQPELWLSDAAPDQAGNNRLSLGLNTWSNKCAFADESKLYCAVPLNLPYGAGLEPNAAEYNEITDQIYEINLTTGSHSLLAIPEGEHAIERLIKPENLNQLWFVDSNSQKIYKINL